MKKFNHFIYIVTLFFSRVVSSTKAQNRISLLRYDDDFLVLKNDSLKKGFDHLKYNSLGDNSFISFGGELREQFQVYNNINFGDVPPSYPDISPNQLWHRLMVHFNIELGNHFDFLSNSTIHFVF